MQAAAADALFLCLPLIPNGWSFCPFCRVRWIGSGCRSVDLPCGCKARFARRARRARTARPPRRQPGHRGLAAGGTDQLHRCLLQTVFLDIAVDRHTMCRWRMISRISMINLPPISAPIQQCLGDVHGYSSLLLKRLNRKQYSAFPGKMYIGKENRIG